VAEAWTAYEPKAKRDNHSWQSDQGRAAHLLQHLGAKQAASLTLKDVEDYRTQRLGEVTQRKTPPTPATLDNEVEMLKRVLNYAVERRELPANPLARVRLLRKPNVRRSVVDEEVFQRLFEASEEALRPVILTAFDTGMRKREVLDLRWEQVDLKRGVIRLAPQDTKAEDARVVVLTARVLAMLEAQPRGLPSTPVFRNPDTGEPWQDIRKPFSRACKKAKLDGLWFHDLRRSFVTKARRTGIAESVVMRMSGHKTRAVFDRYNIVSEDDLREAVRRLDQSLGHVLDTVSEGAPETPKPHPLNTDEASGF
jgi:integrase